MSLFTRRSEYEEKIKKLEIDLKKSESDLAKAMDFTRMQQIKISDLEDKVKLLNKMLTNKDMLIVSNEIEIKKLKEELTENIVSVKKEEEK